MASQEQVPYVLPQQAASTTPPAEPVLTPTTPKSIAIIICSTRPGRVNPAIAQYITSLLPANPPHKLIDLKAIDLPLFNEATIPGGLDATNPTPGYSTSHAREWSTEIRKHDAFVFVTPQYNWSMPASIKNALDYLFHEWVGKAAGVVSYGGHGGRRGGEALEQVLAGLKMRVAKGAEIFLPLREGFALGEKEGEPVPEVEEGMREKWREMGVEEEIRRAYEEVRRLMEESR